MEKIAVWTIPWVARRPLCRLIAAFAGLVLIGSTALAQETGSLPPPDPTGEWLVSKKVARIRIVDCNERMWGIVSWEARAGIDKNNPDNRLRIRPTLGMPILLGMAHTKPNRWDGQIYNSEDGRTYEASISLRDPDTLKVEGCVLGFLCGGEDWSRVAPPDAAAADDLPPAGTAPPASRQTAKPKSGTMPNTSHVTTKLPQAKPQGTSPSPGTAAAAKSPAAEFVTPDAIAAAAPAEICSHVAGFPGLAH